MTADTEISSGYLSSQGVRAAIRRQWVRIASSFVLHISVVFALLIPAIPDPPDPPLPPHVTILMAIPPLPKLKNKPMQQAAAKPPEVKPRIEYHPIDKSKVDASEASFDVHYPPRHLFDILAAFGATLGFVPADRPGYVSARFRPGDWTLVHQGAERRDDFVAFRIEEQYPELDELRKRYNLENCIPFVLFDEAFREKVVSAMQEEAALNGRPGQVHSARVMLSYNPPGLHVVTFKMGGESDSPH